MSVLLWCNKVIKRSINCDRIGIANTTQTLKFSKVRLGWNRGVWVKCGLADRRTGKLRTKHADRVRILPTCVASCHCPRSQWRTNYLVGFTLVMGPSFPPCLHLLFSLLFSEALLPFPPLSLPFPSQSPSRNRIWCCDSWSVGLFDVSCFMNSCSDFLHTFCV